jgi:glycerol-3-phosphate cytidylyltransferase
LRVGFTAGCFDLMHAGHVKMLKDARENACDKLVVAVQSDPSIDRPLTKNSPILPYEDRITLVKACRYVDEVILYDTEKDLYGILEGLMPDVRILGTDYIGKSFTGDDLGIEIYYHERNHGMSTSEVRRLVAESEMKNMSGIT